MNAPVLDRAGLGEKRSQDDRCLRRTDQRRRLQAHRRISRQPLLGHPPAQTVHRLDRLPRPHRHRPRRRPQRSSRRALRAARAGLRAQGVSEQDRALHDERCRSASRRAQLTPAFYGCLRLAFVGAWSLAARPRDQAVPEVGGRAEGAGGPRAEPDAAEHRRRSRLHHCSRDASRSSGRMASRGCCNLPPSCAARMISSCANGPPRSRRWKQRQRRSSRTGCRSSAIRSGSASTIRRRSRSASCGTGRRRRRTGDAGAAAREGEAVLSSGQELSARVRAVRPGFPVALHRRS